MYHQDALWSILLVTPDLDSLEARMPLYMVGIRNPHRLLGVDAIDVMNAYRWRKVWAPSARPMLSPYDLGTQLSPVHQTLKSLTIKTSHSMVQGYDGTQMALTAFKSHTILRISVSFSWTTSSVWSIHQTPMSLT